MKKLGMKEILGIVLCVLLVGAMSLKFYLDYKDKGDETVKVTKRKITEDAKKFKQEYESYNGKTNSTGKNYLNLTILEDNTIVYKNGKEIEELFGNATGLVYFGFNSCPWCRSMIEVLLESVSDNTPIYYVDVKDIRSSFEVNGNKLKETKKGTDEYYKILEKLDEYLSDYKISSDQKEYDTKEKRLYAPTVIALKKGEVVGFHEGTLESQEDPYLGLSEKDKETLMNTFKEMINKTKDSACKDGKGC